jgi:putative ABC transport system ATP-binding protein|tara:strand:+ start:2525 stop:3214 length:690 start_codon:yes stop_codon:yes gene_type:complete
MVSPIVELKDATRIYQQGGVEVAALRGLSLQIQSGEFAALSGPSGSGKTTTLNLIGALDAPTNGQVFLEGQDLGTLNRRELSHLRRDRIGFVFQSYNLIPVLTAYENAELVVSVQGMAADERRDKVMSLLKDVGLDGLENRRPNELSGGQQQRVAIARALASNPAVILADEPTANVDSETAIHLLDLMQALNQSHEATFIFSTHDERVIDRAKRVIRMVDGQVVNDELK